MRRATALLLLIFASAGCCSPCGDPCSSCQPLLCFESCLYHRRFDDCHAAMAARRCASEKLMGCYSYDYRHGFTQAYIDLSQGATGAVPPVPPEQYWSTCFRTCWGHDRAREWFEGYSDGIASARGGLGAPCQTIPASGSYYDAGPSYRNSGSQPFGG